MRVSALVTGMLRWTHRQCWKILAVLIVMAAGRIFAPTPRTSGPISNEVFVWQRAWGKPVKEAIAQRQEAFAGIIPLAAEVDLKPAEPAVFRAPLDWDALRATGKPIGLALRIGPYAGPFSPDDLPVSLAESLVSNARSNRVSVSELQLDFDCAESRLADYRRWVEAIKQALPDTRVTITALPSWLDRWSFRSLAKSADGYVLQVHTLSHPAGDANGPVICDPKAARKAVERAARIGVPFRVALPTYGYTVGYGSDGSLVGLFAEGPEPDWPAATKTLRVMSKPGELAELVREWTADRPAAMKGLIWYRLPVEGDRSNWRWPTLAAVMRGRTPSQQLATHARSPKPGLTEIELVNSGEAEAKVSGAFTVRWRDARLIAGDGLQGFTLARETAHEVTFVRSSGANDAHLPPKESAKIGWLRFDQPTDIDVESDATFKL